MDVLEILKQSTVEANIIKLPPIQLDRKDYLKVKKKMELIGGKWKGGKIAGFVFEQDPTDLLNQIANGDKRDLKKEFQFFETPADIADELVDLAYLLLEEQTVLEPSAGRGAIIKAINRKFPNKIVDCCELMELNQSFLDKMETANLIANDFIESEIDKKYDTIIANPPFSKNQDIDHIRKMYDCLKDGGRLVSIASVHWKFTNNRKEREFRQWLEEKEAEIISLDPDEFKKSGTKVPTTIIIINKF